MTGSGGEEVAEGMEFLLLLSLPFLLWLKQEVVENKIPVLQIPGF